MRVIRNSGQNVSPSDDGRLYNQAFEDGLFEATSITSLGGNLVGLGAMYGIICGRDFTAESQSVNVLLPDDGTETGYIYIQYDTTTEDIISIESALAPFTPQYDDINTSGTICQMILAEYEANSVAVTDITSVYPIATTKPNNSLIGSMATVEASPATASHTVGSYILWNYQLYKVISAISVGETLVVGSNIESTDVGSEISDLNTMKNRSATTPDISITYYSGYTYANMLYQVSQQIDYAKITENSFIRWGANVFRVMRIFATYAEYASGFGNSTNSIYELFCHIQNGNNYMVGMHNGTVADYSSTSAESYGDLHFYY